ncbi:glycosyl hydrolase family 28-related protein [Paenibacillus sp. RC67]|uniref:glycosyl hydrolase family 28-related protein n=1 Tax=Paenibacillus sp. RC67 TaxID=3039392 RepID=UPI0024ACBA02|nr:glycosyl hydrolase family 28-related protein [Paenibacillus sp. RC67]
MTETKNTSRRNFVKAISAAGVSLLGAGALLGAVPASSQTVTSSVYGGDPNGSPPYCGDLLLNVKDYGAAGDGTDATQAFLDCYRDMAARTNRGIIFIPAGDYIIRQTIPHHSWIQTIGAGKKATNLLIDHNGPGFEFVVGDDRRTPDQGGDTVMRGLTIKRKTAPVDKITGNYAIRVHGTFGYTIFEDIVIRDMGDSAIMIYDETGIRGTGPTVFHNMEAVTNLFGYGLECIGTFANIYCDKFHSWGNAGGYHFDATPESPETPDGKRRVNYYPFQIVIRDCDAEWAGGYSANFVATAKSPLPALRARFIRGLHVSGSTLINSTNSNQHLVDLDYCQNVDLNGGSDLIARGGAEYDVVHLGPGCSYVNIGNVNIYGSDQSRYGIYADNVKGLAIRQPKVAGVRNSFKITVTTNKAYLETEKYCGFLDRTYIGFSTTMPLSAFETPLYSNSAKAWVIFGWNGSAVALKDSYNVSSVSRTSAGVYVVNWTKPFATTNYCVLVNGKKSSGIGLLETMGYGQGSVIVNGFGTDAVPADFETVSLVAYGN